MADILDQKQEVLKVELTKHGRKLLGMGLFYPKYFCFFDDSVLYDTSYGNVEEEINNIEGRILNNSLTFSSLNNTKEILTNKLGTSHSLNDYAPAWSLDILKGAISEYQSNSTYSKKIFNMRDVKCHVLYDSKSKEPNVENDYILIKLEELNITDDIENFEIELLAKDELSGQYNKLYFHTKMTNIVDDILYEENELPFKFFQADINTEHASYYFDVLVDDEIDTEYIITTDKAIADRVKGTYSSEYLGPVEIKC